MSVSCGKYVGTFSMADVKESEERYLAQVVDVVHELDLGVTKHAGLPNVVAVV